MKLNYFSVAEYNGYRIKIRIQLIGKILLNIILSVLQLSFMQLGSHTCLQRNFCLTKKYLVNKEILEV